MRRIDPPLGTRTFLAAGLVTVALAAVAGCGGQGEPRRADEEGGGGTIVIATSIDIRDVNELTSDPSAIHTALHNFALFLNLLEEQPDFAEGPPTFKPLLAESYEFADDKKTLTFHLHPDVSWSDGVPVTADDVRFTWEAQTSPEVGWTLAEVKAHIEDVEVVDPQTVRFHFDKAYATQLLDVNQGVILPKHAWGKRPFSEWRQDVDWFRENLVVAGPFTLESWEPQQRYVLKKNEHYFEPGLPRTERIVFQIVTDRLSQMAMFRSGEAQIMDWARPADAAALEADPEIRIESYSIRGFNALIWNVENPLFTSPKVRRALTQAIDRQAIVDSLYYGFVKEAIGPYTSDLWVYNRDLEPWPYDPDAATAALAAEGWRDTDGDGVLDKDGQPFSFEILTPAGNELRRDILVMIQQQLKRVGIEAQPQTIEFNTQISRELEDDFEASFNSWSIPTNLDLSVFFHSREIAEGYNTANFSDPEVDRVLDEIGDAVDQLAAKPLYDRLQALLHESQPYTFLYEPMRLVPIRSSLQGVRPNTLSTFYNLKEWELRGE